MKNNCERVGCVENNFTQLSNGKNTYSSHIFVTLITTDLKSSTEIDFGRAEKKMDDKSKTSFFSFDTIARYRSRCRPLELEALKCTEENIGDKSVCAGIVKQ
jgi:hypothetical protein